MPTWLADLCVQALSTRHFRPAQRMACLVGSGARCSVLFQLAERSESGGKSLRPFFLLRFHRRACRVHPRAVLRIEP